METWSDLAVVHRGERVAIAGNGFAAIGRLELLTLLYQRAEQLGVRLLFEQVVDDLSSLADADLIVAADGAFSHIRQSREAELGTTTDWRPNRFIWYGTSRRFDTLTLTFRDTPEGVFCAHHYRYSPTMSTFLVEVEDATWHRAGFETMSPEATRHRIEQVFATDLGGHPVLSNHSHWRQFPAIWNERWHTGNIVLLGDALRTAHFSIGSGTRMAMEDAMALHKALIGSNDLPSALATFQQERRPVMKKIWDAANVSLRWYEHMGELMALDPLDFAYAYMRRTGRVSHAAIRRMDPRLAAAWEAAHPGEIPD
jgi:2-polyprenyl-6-methoxyphenol hydroxylase-like FAD-dependent oxidoreductase